MKILVYSSQEHDRHFLDQANAVGRHGHTVEHTPAGLTVQTATLAAGFGAVSVFVNDVADRPVLERLASEGVRLIALRAAGFNNIDIGAAAELGLTVARVPAYSPYAVAEHTVALMLTLNRKTHRAFTRVRDQNFALTGLLGFDMRGKTVGIVGTGKIGECVARILNGFGCRLLAFDPNPNPAVQALGAEYVSGKELAHQSDIITLHCPLLPQTRHLVNDEMFSIMKRGVMLINTSRGALVDTKAAIRALKTGKLGSLGVDVYEEEGDLFFRDLSGVVLQDDVFTRLTTFPNVLVTAHQAFFTAEALTNIADTTMGNVTDFEKGGVKPGNRVGPEMVR